MKKRLPYIIATVILLAVEIYIGMFVRDKFIRPYGGDILVTMLLCTLIRSAIGAKRSVKQSGVICVLVFIFSVVVEITQYFRLDKFLGVDGTLLGIIIGSGFSYIDIVCYAVGCLLFFAAEQIVLSQLKCSTPNKSNL